MEVRDSVCVTLQPCRAGTVWTSVGLASAGAGASVRSDADLDLVLDQFLLSLE